MFFPPPTWVTSLAWCPSRFLSSTAASLQDSLPSPVFRIAVVAKPLWFLSPQFFLNLSSSSSSLSLLTIVVQTVTIAHLSVWMLTQSCPTLCGPMHYSSPGSSVHGILQAGMVESVAILFSTGYSGSRIRPTSLTSPALAAVLLLHLHLFLSPVIHSLRGNL